MNVLIIAPHPDDEVIGCGGTMAKLKAAGHNVFVCVVARPTEDMYIDEEALDVELFEQPSLVEKYSRLLAETKLERDILKEAMELQKAEISLDIRDNPQDYKLEKVTDKAVEACVLMEDEYKQAQSTYHKANFDVNVLQGIMTALEHRKSSLEKLVTLHGQNYFAGPIVPHDIKELRKEKEEARNRRVSQNISKKKELTRSKPKS